MGSRVIGHTGSTSVFGLVGEPPKRMRLMCPLSMPTLKVISGQACVRTRERGGKSAGGALTEPYSPLV
jgi:hypothetical protein